MQKVFLIALQKIRLKIFVTAKLSKNIIDFLEALYFEISLNFSETFLAWFNPSVPLVCRVYLSCQAVCRIAK